MRREYYERLDNLTRKSDANYPKGTFRSGCLNDYLTIIPRARVGSEAIAIDSEAMRARGIIVLVKSNLLVRKISRLNIFRKLKLDINPFSPSKHYRYGARFLLLVGYNV